MKAERNIVVSLLGQPNSGKSTLFNMLTASHQHVGNWPGKTVERKEGTFFYQNNSYLVVDLPGSYSLSANSEEEIVTRDYIASDQSDVVCILADASQLKRSLYMLADFVGINTPAVLLLNMIDVANDKGIKIDVKRIEKQLGIPVLPFVAADRSEYHNFYKQIEDSVKNPCGLKVENLKIIYENVIGEAFSQLCAVLPENGIEQYSKIWLAAKVLEGDAPIIEKIKECLSTEHILRFNSILSSIENSCLLVGDSKFKWIDGILDGAVTESKKANTKLTKFDRAATSRK